MDIRMRVCGEVCGLSRRAKVGVYDEPGVIKFLQQDHARGDAPGRQLGRGQTDGIGSDALRLCLLKPL